MNMKGALLFSLLSLALTLSLVNGLTYPDYNSCQQCTAKAKTNTKLKWCKNGSGSCIDDNSCGAGNIVTQTDKCYAYTLTITDSEY